MKLDLSTGSFYLAMLASDKTAAGKAIKFEREGNLSRIIFELEDSILAPTIETLHFKQLMLMLNMAGSFDNSPQTLEWSGYDSDSEPFRFSIYYSKESNLYIFDWADLDLENYDLRFSPRGWEEFSRFLWQCYTAQELKKSLKSITGLEVVDE